MKKNVVIITSGSGSLIEICLKFDFFKNAIHSILTDRDCGAVEIAKKNVIPFEIINEKNLKKWSDKTLNYLDKHDIEYVLSYSNLKIFRGDILKKYSNRIFNSHFSILPAF